MNPHRLQIGDIREAEASIDPVFLNTPQFPSAGLSNLLDLELIAKIETLNPIRSFKGRGTEVLATRFEKGTSLICASAGNFGQALAYSCNKRQIKLVVYASTNANPFKVQMMRAFGAQVVLAGNDYDEAKSKAKQIAEEGNSHWVEDGKNLETLIGAGTIGLELIKYPHRLDAVLVPLGNGALMTGIAKVMKELSPHTRMISIQARGAPAMTESIRQNKVVNLPSVNTISDGIAVRLPIQEIIHDLENLVDATLLVSDEATITGMKLIHQHLGIVSEPSGAVGVAALLENPNLFKGKRIAMILCGGNLTTEQIQRWILSR